MSTHTRGLVQQLACHLTLLDGGTVDSIYSPFFVQMCAYLIIVTIINAHPPFYHI